MHKPFYVTEIGLVGEGDGRGQPVQAGSDRLEHDEEQERAQVEHLVKSQVIVR
jgi:hypothetical protein